MYDLNLYARYASLAWFLERYAPPDRSFLEVGSGAHGLPLCYPEYRVTGVDLAFPGPRHDALAPVQARGDRLPFDDAAFDVVLSLDTLEHVPPEQREPFIDELLRVSGDFVVLGFPAGAPYAAFMKTLIGWCRKTKRAIPGWLQEHEDLPLPDAGHVEALLKNRDDVRFEVRDSESLLLFLAGIGGDFVADFYRFRGKQLEGEEAVWFDLMKQADRGICCRKIFYIRKFAKSGKVRYPQYDAGLFQSETAAQHYRYLAEANAELTEEMLRLRGKARQLRWYEENYPVLAQQKKELAEALQKVQSQLRWYEQNYPLLVEQKKTLEARLAGKDAPPVDEKERPHEPSGEQ